MTHAVRQEIDALRTRAEEGVASAQFNLGDRYVTGEGVPQDAVEAVAWTRKAAEPWRATASACGSARRTLVGQEGPVER